MNGNLKVLYTASTAGHLRSFHVPYLEMLREKGCFVIAAAAGSGEGLPVDEYIRLPLQKSMSPLKNLPALFKLIRLMRKERFGLICTHTSLAAFFTRLALMPAGKKNCVCVNTVHGYLFDETTPFLKKTALLTAEKVTARVTDRVVVMNKADAQIALRHRLYRNDLAAIDGMGIDMPRFSPADAAEKTQIRRRYAIPEDAFVISCAAEFSKRKAQAQLIRAMALLPENVFLLLAGQGDTLDECRALSRSAGAEHRVRFLGFVKEVRDVFAASDAYVSASRSEGLPFSVMEAMLCGLPAVLSDVKGHSDLVLEKHTGILFPYGDIGAYAKAVRYLIDNPEARAEMGLIARHEAAAYPLERVKNKTFATITGERV